MNLRTAAVTRNVPPLDISKPCSFHQLTLNREPWNFEPELRIFLHRLPTKRTETECWFQRLAAIGAGLTGLFPGLSPYPS
jgi:hypothetical protein